MEDRQDEIIDLLKKIERSLDVLAFMGICFGGTIIALLILISTEITK